MINKIHERALRLIHQDNSHFKVLLEKQKEFSIHQRNLQVLMDWNLQNIKLYCPTFNEVPISVLHKSIESQKFQELSTEKRNTVNYGLETLTYRAPAIWAKLPPKYVDATSMDEFEPKIKSWKCEICSWRLCKNYQPNLGYIN